MCNRTIAYHNPKPSYRTYIKKKNGKLRPLSIPVIIDRIWQNVMKMALEHNGNTVLNQPLMDSDQKEAAMMRLSESINTWCSEKGDGI